MARQVDGPASEIEEEDSSSSRVFNDSSAMGDIKIDESSIEGNPYVKPPKRN